MGYEHLERLVVGLYERNLLQFSNFKWLLSSGRRSSIYYNQRPILSHNGSEMGKLVVRDAVKAYAEKADHYKAADHMYGIPQSMNSISGAVAFESGKSLLWERIGDKAYGQHDSIEGSFVVGQEVVQLDDVVTTAHTKLKSATNLEGHGLITKKFIVMVDREEGGVETIEEAGYEIESIVGLSAAVRILRDNGRIGQREIGWVEHYHAGLRQSGEISTFNLT